MFEVVEIEEEIEPAIPAVYNEWGLVTPAEAPLEASDELPAETTL